MNRRDWVWVSLKVFAVYALLQAAIAAFEAFQSGLQWYVSSMNSVNLVGNDAALMSLNTGLIETSQFLFIRSIVRFILMGLLGIYLARRGNWLLNFVCGPESP